MGQNFKKKVKISDRWIGDGLPTFVVAEVGPNHLGDMDIAKKMIEAAAEAGADAVKFQAWKAARMASKFTPMSEYQKTEGDNFQELLRPLELNLEQNEELMDYAKKLSLIWFSTPFDEQSADMLEKLNPPVFKIGSGEIGNFPFLEHVAKKGKPIIISTGMATLAEVSESIMTIEKYNAQIIVLQCTSTYPSNYEDVNLRAMETLRLAFQHPVGFSNHTLGIYVPLAAVALGAVLVETHFTLDRNMPGWDQKASFEPSELKEMVKGIRIVEKALGSSRKFPAEGEFDVRYNAYKSIIADRDIPKGTIIARDMLTTKRPGLGIAPKFIDFIVGRTAKVDIEEDAIITLDMIY